MLEVYGMSKKGKDHVENEDAFLIDEQKNLFAVADGVSIPSGGGLASKLFVEYLKKCFKTSLKEAFECANEKTIEERKIAPVGYTTCVAVWIKDKKAEVASVGDSVAVLIRNGRLKILNEIDRGFDGTLLQAIGNEEIIVHINTVDLKKGDIIVLMTDGISDVISTDIILKIVLKEKSVERIAKSLVDAAEKSISFYNDDKTVVVLKYG